MLRFARLPSRPLRYQLVRSVFLRGLGAVYLIAFTSLERQVLGLYGRRGILPASEFLERVRSVVGTERYREFPTLLWIDASDRALLLHCKAGRFTALALLFDVAPRTSALILWTLYLSLVTVGQEFLAFQWDVLLLEAGLLAIIVAPSGVAPAIRATPPSSMAVALMRWLVFRLYFESGLVKVRSGDATWRNLSACCHHYATQPLPNRVGWYAHHLPRRVQRLSTATVLGLECVMPFLVLGPRRARRVAFWFLSGLQGAIALTGNYGFFNLLSFVLGVWLLDDDVVERLAGRAPRPRASGAPRMPRTIFDILVGGPLLELSAATLARRFGLGRPLMHRLGRVARSLAKLDELALPFHSVNSYGLFAVMTTRRPEIVVEGSNDGVRWREYAFRYKPGDLSDPPRQAAPHQPRLDWQMWFAALGPPPDWFIAFLIRLLEGAPEVLALLKENPFDEPPRYVRALLYDYRMTSAEAKRQSGHWWERELLGLYVPPVALSPRHSPPWGSPRPEAAPT